MDRLLVTILIVLFPLPAVAAGGWHDMPLLAAIYAYLTLYLLCGWLVMAFGYGFSAMRALPATVAALLLALILLVVLWTTYGLEKALHGMLAAGAALLLFSPMLALGVYLGRRAARRAAARKLLSTHGT